MKRFLAVYTGSQEGTEKSGWNALSDADRKEREQRGIKAWMDWAAAHKDAIVENGGMLGKTKRAGPEGRADIRNNLAGYVVVQAQSHDEAAKMFEGHPHFTIFPGQSVEIMEIIAPPSK